MNITNIPVITDILKIANENIPAIQESFQLLTNDSAKLRVYASQLNDGNIFVCLFVAFFL